MYFLELGSECFFSFPNCRILSGYHSNVVFFSYNFIIFLVTVGSVIFSFFVYNFIFTPSFFCVFHFIVFLKTLQKVFLE